MFCPSCDLKMLCPCEACIPHNEGQPGVYWKFRGDAVICGNCLYSPEAEFSEFDGDLVDFLRSGWVGVELRQMADDEFWPSEIEE